MEQVMRNVLLLMAKNRKANQLARRYGLRLGAQRFVAGQTLAEAISTVQTLNAKQLLVTLDHLGESVFTEAEAIQSADACVQTLAAISERGVRSHLSIKLTQLGMDLSRDLCKENVIRILEEAKKHNNFVRIDMEDYAHNEKTIALFRELHATYGNTVGLVIQAYLYKSEKDVAQLGELNANLRIVKGAYKEDASVAFPNKADVDKNFLHLAQQHLANGHYTAIATHDEAIIEQMKQFVASQHIPKDAFEFQMLYGIRPQLQQQLALEGYKVRIYVPYGDDWYAYFMRRLAERPANVSFVVKSMIHA
ncbi:proline dehydrogenase family protein [Sulfoacidibacillus thermotolerans]|uniref:proline dehydrogenase n=1 Tax=Sulfoacidibacillus thermotolerans TaxID=1765684 RepID=A0A2U3DCI1_SULT2|nr:proline dehydrogenase family protein [Sulfoacidibacillus thermotolerans]PWI58994.1 proline dehydrogenase [Sulfoacidibacillus thermotolerans]